MIFSILQHIQNLSPGKLRNNSKGFTMNRLFFLFGNEFTNAQQWYLLCLAEVITTQPSL